MNKDFNASNNCGRSGTAKPGFDTGSLCKTTSTLSKQSSRLIPCPLGKKREIHNHHFDSTIWNDFVFRPGDIVIASYAKSGTTWTQQIVGQLLFGPDPHLPVADMSPWMDLRVPPKEVKLAAVDAQNHRRFLKTHLPTDALVFSPLARYIYVSRDARDIVWSLHNHHANANDQWYRALNDTPGRVGPPIIPPTSDIVQYWDDWLQNDGYPFWPFWENLRSWWSIRLLPNVLLVHFADLKHDMPGQIRRIANFIGAEIDVSQWDQTLEYCSFTWMRKNAAKSLPLNGAFWNGGTETFINRGTNGRWREILSPEQNAEYETRAYRELGEDCANWLIYGSAKAFPDDAKSMSNINTELPNRWLDRGGRNCEANHSRQRVAVANGS